MSANESEELKRLFDLRRPPVMQEQEADRVSSGRRTSDLDVSNGDPKKNIEQYIARPHSPGVLDEPAETPACTPHSRKLEQRTSDQRLLAQTPEHQSPTPREKDPSNWEIIKNISSMGGWPEHIIQNYQNEVENVIERAAAKSSARIDDGRPPSCVGVGGSSVTTQPGLSSADSMFPRANLTVPLGKGHCQWLRARLDTGSDLNIMGASAASRLTDVATLKDCKQFDFDYEVRGVSAVLPIHKFMKVTFFVNFVTKVRKAIVFIVEDCYIDNRFDVLLGEACVKAYELLREGPGLLPVSNAQVSNAEGVDMTHGAAAQIKV